ncbi:hypothetical protein GCM10023185_09320 [Hymenobacter saemangeumensis]|uniref:Uncharacterized protein n=2 Tax=Hymenobacter saemangeumensis TaxID=1084522 RepID=A0ABP8I4A3_9BACT
MLLPLLEQHLTPPELATLKRAAGNSLRRNAWHYTSMMEDFARPAGANKQAAKAAELLEYPLPAASDASIADYADPEQVRLLLQELSPRLAKNMGHNNYLTDRLDRKARQAAGLGDLSRRQYNKRFRALRHLEEKLQQLVFTSQQHQLQMVSKHGFAHEIAYEDFSRDLFSAAFIAYYTARCNLRSEFTNQSQERPFNTVADMLFRRCRDGQPPVSALRRWVTGALPPTGSSPAPAWWAIAQVYPAPQVLAQLSDEQKGELLGRWTALLQELADVLRHTWAANTFRRDSMVVKRGDDSSTWNITAGAWNKARDNWINLLYALGMEFVLEDLCPGKVLRLMAADVVAWHQQTGGQLDPNTLVWADLPLPWEVLNGTATCTRETVAAACARAGLNAAKSGWLAPRPHQVVPFRPTPELVHGVSVSNPYLALVLRKNKVFSGKLLPDF